MCVCARKRENEREKEGERERDHQQIRLIRRETAQHSHSEPPTKEKAVAQAGAFVWMAKRQSVLSAEKKLHK